MPCIFEENSIIRKYYMNIIDEVSNEWYAACACLTYGLEYSISFKKHKPFTRYQIDILLKNSFAFIIVLDNKEYLILFTLNGTFLIDMHNSNFDNSKTIGDYIVIKTKIDSCFLNNLGYQALDNNHGQYVIVTDKTKKIYDIFGIENNQLKCLNNYSNHSMINNNAFLSREINHIDINKISSIL